MDVRTIAVNVVRTVRQNKALALVLLIAVANDVFDYFGGAVPVIGDVLDLGTTAVLYPTVGDVGTLASAIEFIPGADFLPTYTAITLWAFWQEYKEQGSVTVKSDL